MDSVQFKRESHRFFDVDTLTRTDIRTPRPLIPIKMLRPFLRNDHLLIQRLSKEAINYKLVGVLSTPKGKHQRQKLLLCISNYSLANAMVLDVEESGVHRSGSDLASERFTVFDIGGIQSRQVYHGDLLRGAVAGWGVEHIAVYAAVRCPEL
jgi:hypothetical protein